MSVVLCCCCCCYMHKRVTPCLFGVGMCVCVCIGVCVLAGGTDRLRALSLI